MKKLYLLLFAFSLLLQSTFAQVVLDADGPGETYELITSVLAPGHNPVEVPDCSHPDFGRHIDEEFDADLDSYIFRFFIHTSPDDDRCINFDRQRNEIKTYDKSPDNLLGIEGEKVIYKWKFKLDAGFQASPNFTHLHQLKSVGGALASMPMYTLTARKGSPDQLELRYAETDKQITLKKIALAPLIDTWLEVTEKIEYGSSGTYQIEIKKVSDTSILFSYSTNSIINWRPGADFVRPKWGIYRSLINDQDLRDEIVKFASFSIEEVMTLSVADFDNRADAFQIVPNPVSNTLFLKKLPRDTDLVEIYNLEGRKLYSKSLSSEIDQDLDVSNFSDGLYIVKIIGSQVNHSKLALIIQ